MSVFAEDIATARELIDIYGAACLWQKAAPVDDTVPGYPTEGVAPDPVPCKIAFFSPKDIGRGSGEFLALLAGTEVPQGVEVGLMAGDVPFTPEMPDTLTQDGVELAITGIDRVAPNGTPILYYIQVTR